MTGDARLIFAGGRGRRPHAKRPRGVLPSPCGSRDDGAARRAHGAARFGRVRALGFRGELLLLSLATGDGSVAILPLASAPEGDTYADWAHKGLTHFEELGVPARVVEVKERRDAFKQELIGELERVSVIFFSGGNPAFLADAVTGTPLGEALISTLDRGAALAGCSAGACLLGEASPESVTHRIEEDTWVAGMRLLPGVWVVPHWDALGDRVREYFLSRIPPSGVTLGIDENTMLVRAPDRWVVFGDGSVSVRAGGDEFRLRAGGEMPPEAMLPAASP